MKKILLLLSLFAFTFGMACAQNKQKGGEPNPKMMKEIQEYKIKFLAQEMELKDDQIPKFTELYEKMSEEKRANFMNMRKLEKSLKSNSSEAEYKEVSDKISDCRLKDAQIDKEYDAKFATFLTQKQIYKMKAAEEKFRRKMHEMRHKKK